MLMLFLMHVVVSVCIPFQQAALRLFSAKLEKDASMWSKHCAALSDYTSSQRVGKVEFLRAQDRQLAEAIEAQADVQFPVKCIANADNVAPFVSTCASVWCEKQVIPTANQFTVYLVNLTAPGSMAMRALREATRLVADACAHCPERTCGIIIAPNVAGHGKTYDEVEIQKVQDEAEAFLRQESYSLKVRRGQFVFSNESINSRTRSCVHPLLMCLSDHLHAESGELVSLFQNSQLWHRRAVSGIKMKPNSDYVVPIQGQTAINVENLSKAQVHKQHVTGVDLIDKLKEALWKGLGLTQQHGAVLVDLLPYDDSVLLSTVQGSSRARPKEPQEMVVTCCWARGDQDVDIRKKNAAWLVGVISRGMDRLVRQKLLCLPGFTLKEHQPEGAKPTTEPSFYHLTFPTAEGNLALRQTALDEWSPKFARLKKEFDALIEKHNKAFNSSGCPYKADGKKRSAEAGADEIEEDGESFPDDCVVQSLEALGKAKGAVTTVHSEQPELFRFIFTSKGELYLHALEDGIVSAKKPLFQTFGEYHTGDAEIEKATKRKALLYSWTMGSADDEAMWGHPSSWDPPFRKSPATFRQFVDYLAEQNVVTFDVACHEVSGEDAIQVKQVEGCAFEPKKLPGRTVADLSNCGSLLPFASVDWEKGETKNGTMRLCMVLNYEDSQQQKGIFPSKPCWMLAKPKRILKGKCFRLVSPS